MSFEIKGNYFDGDFQLPPMSGPQATEIYIKRFSPANTEQLLWNAPIDHRHVEPLIQSAREGFQTWRNTSITERINYFKRYQEELLSLKDQIAEAIASEVGKPLWEAKTEAAALISKVDITINDSLPRIANKSFEDIAPDTKGSITYKPVGPSFIIGPFNFPCHLANGQILSALISGNSIIFKPSEKTFYSTQLMFEAFHRASFPKGVVNFILGDGETAKRILKDKSIKGVFFTGSKDVGKRILKSTSDDLGKLVSLELGGKNTTIIEADSFNDFTMSELLKSCYLTTGQRCTSTAIVAIHRSIHEEFVAKFHDLTKKIVVDHPIDFEKTPFMGPLIDQNSMETYLSYMGMAKREGIEEIMRGKQLEKKYQGYYVSPSIHLAKKLIPNSHFLQAEIFGPNCTFIPYEDFDEAINIANSTEYGLACSIFSQDQSKFEQAINNIDAGIINLNRSTVGASAKLPFGGVKNSGNYRPAAVTTIDSCVYQVASLELTKREENSLENIIGLDLD